MPLTRERIVGAALSLADAEGLDAVTMRRLGRALGVEGMALYRHVPNRAAILDGIAEAVIDEIEVPEATDWRDGVLALAEEFRRVALAHPHVVPLWTTRPLSSEAGLRPVEGALTILRRAGLNDEETVGALWTFLAYMAGALLTEVASDVGLAETSTGWSRTFVDTLSPERFPAVHSLAAPFSADGWEREYRRGIEILLAGLESRRPAPRGGTESD